MCKGEEPLQHSMISQSDVRTWYVGFCVGINANYWYSKFVSKEWRHCFVFGQVADVVQIIDPTTKGMDIRLQAADNGGALNAVDFAKHLTYHGYTIVEFDHEPEVLKLSSVIAPSCVTVVKAVLGFNCLSLTPKQLCMALLKRGGTLIKGDCYDRSNEAKSTNTERGRG